MRVTVKAANSRATTTTKASGALLNWLEKYFFFSLALFFFCGIVPHG
jgi:hypothetical protein